MAMTAEEFAQAKSGVAAAKVAAVQPLIDALNGASGEALKAAAATALATLDASDAIYGDVQSVANVLRLLPGNLTAKLAPLQAVATPPEPATAAAP